MAENLILCNRYAKALFDLAEETDQIEGVYQDMKLVERVFYENLSLQGVMKNQIIKNKSKNDIVRELFASKVSKLSLEFLSFVVRKDRSKSLMGIANAYIEFYKEHKNITTVILYTTDLADEETKDSIISVVSRFTDKTVEIQNKIDKSLIGGFRLFFDGHLYDASLFAKFQKLTRSFSVNVYDKSL